MPLRVDEVPRLGEHGLRYILSIRHVQSHMSNFIPQFIESVSLQTSRRHRHPHARRLHVPLEYFRPLAVPAREDPLLRHPGGHPHDDGVEERPADRPPRANVDGEQGDRPPEELLSEAAGGGEDYGQLQFSAVKTIVLLVRMTGIPPKPGVQ